MKKHLPLTIAGLAIVLSVAIVAWFVPRMRRVVEAEANPAIRLPIAPPEPPSDDSNALRLRLTTEGAVYAGETRLTEAELQQLLAANPARSVIVEIAPEVKYELLRALLRRLQAAGVKDPVVKAKSTTP